jgi:hypothetical protein
MTETAERTVIVGDIRAERLSAQELGVQLFEQPPAGFDPISAAPRDLLTYGYPARPDAATHPAQRAQWERRVARSYARTEPEFVRNVGKVHGPMRRPATSATSNAKSTNWSGSVVFASAGTTCSWIEGEWTVPDPCDPLGGESSYHSAAWVGLDGDGSTNVLQAGTESSVIDGSRSVYAWWEWYPDHEIAVSNFPVAAGDLIFCLICADSTTTASIYLTNDTTGQQVAFNVTAPDGTRLEGNCAEWIVEAPSVGGNATTLPDYGVVYFDDALAGERNGGSLDAFTGSAITLVRDVSDVDGADPPLSVPTMEKSRLIKLSYREV